MEDKKKALEEVMKTYYSEFVRTARGYFGFRNGDAEDFVHDVFIYVLDNLDKLKSTETLKGWIFFNMKSLIQQRRSLNGNRMKAMVIRQYIITYLTEDALAYNTGPANLAREEYQKMLKSLPIKEEHLEIYIRSLSIPKKDTKGELKVIAEEYGYHLTYLRSIINSIEKKVAIAVKAIV